MSAVGQPRQHAALAQTDYPCDATLSRDGSNVLRFAFDVPVLAPFAGEIEKDLGFRHASSNPLPFVFVEYVVAEMQPGSGVPQGGTA